MILALFIKRYLYNGKELIEDNGLHYYDYGARMYDASIGRWSVVDPMGEKYVSNTSYNYALNNPILLVDPDGREIHVSNLSASHQKSLLDFSRTKEGKAFLAQFAVGGKEYVIAGERVSFEGSGQYANQHLFFSSTDATPTGRTISKLWNPRGHFKRLQEVNMGDVKESLRSKHGIGIGYDILIGNQQQGDDALYTIAHESFLHVNKTAAKVQRGIDDYRSGKLDQDA